MKIKKYENNTAGRFGEKIENKITGERRNKCGDKNKNDSEKKIYNKKYVK